MLDLTPNELENALQSIKHHVEDCLEDLEDIGYVEKALQDILDVVEELQSVLPDEFADDLVGDHEAADSEEEFEIRSENKLRSKEKNKNILIEDILKEMDFLGQ